MAIRTGMASEAFFMKRVRVFSIVETFYCLSLLHMETCTSQIMAVKVERAETKKVRLAQLWCAVL